MNEKIVRLTGTTRVDEYGCPRQDSIAYLKVGDPLKGFVESGWVVITDQDNAEIGEIRGFDSDLIIRAAKQGHIINFTVSKLKETDLGKINVHILVKTYTKKEAQKLAASGTNE